MSAEDLISDCERAGIFIYLDGGALKMKGGPEAVRQAAERLRPHKAELLDYFATNPERAICGAFTPYCPPVSREMVDELHRLIEHYSALYQLAHDQTQRIINEAKHQPLASVPNSIEFFTKRIEEKS